MADEELHTNTHVDFDFGGVKMGGWTSVDMPSGNVSVPEVFHWDEKGSPMKATTTGNVTWNQVNASRLYNQTAYNDLWKMYEEAITKGPAAKKEFKISICDKENKPLTTYSLPGSYISSVNTTNQTAGGNEIKLINISVHYDDAKKA